MNREAGKRERGTKKLFDLKSVQFRWLWGMFDALFFPVFQAIQSYSRIEKFVSGEIPCNLFGVG